MELKFKNITKSSVQIYKDFLRFHNKKFGKKEEFNLFMMLLFIVYIIVFNIKIGNFKFLVIVLIIGLIALFSYKVYHRETVADKQMKSHKVQSKDEFVYNFYNFYFEIIRNNKKQRIWYVRLYRIYQDNINFYFYIDETHAYVMSKDGFIKGNLEDFKEFISKRCILKYRKNNYAD